MVGRGVLLLGANGDAFGRRFEEGEGEALGGGADVEVDEAGAGDVDADAHDLEPEEEILGLEAGEGVDHAVAEVAGDVALVMQLVLELGVAGLVKAHPEEPVLAHRELPHALGEQAHGQPVLAQDLVDGRRIATQAQRRGPGARNNDWKDKDEDDGVREGKHGLVFFFFLVFVVF